MLKSRRTKQLIIWSLVALALWPFRGRLERELRATNPVANSASALADSRLQSEFNSASRETALLVIGGLPVRADSQSGRAIVRRIVTPLQSVRGVGTIISPASSLDTMLVGSSGTVALALVGLTTDEPSVLAALRERTDRILVAERATNPALTIQWTGQPAVLADLRTSGAAAAARAELFAIPLTLLVAWWAFGSVTNALLAVVVAALVTIIGTGAMGLLSVVFPPSIMARSIVSLVGLALTVDYLLLMTRAHGAKDIASRQRAKKTALLAAVIVAAGFVGLTAAPTGELRTTAITGALVAILAALGAISFGAGTSPATASAASASSATAASPTGASATIVPEPTSPSTSSSGVTSSATTSSAAASSATSSLTANAEPNKRWYAWGTLVTRHPLRFVVLSMLPLLFLANHARSAILSTPLDNWLPKESESTRALNLLSQEHRINVAGTAHVLLRLPPGTPVLSEKGWAVLNHVSTVIRQRPHAGDVYAISTIGTGELTVAQQVFPAAVRDRYVSRDGQTALLDIVPSGGSETAGAIALVGELRSLDASQVTELIGAELLVSGLPAYSVDYQAATRKALPWVVLAATLATLAALLIALRAPLVAIKAVTLNLLVAAAALGATVFVFQDGVGISLFGREAVGSILPTVPLLGFAATFGISMDYELFLLNAILGVRTAGRSERDAIALGVSRSAGLITRAACVMITVFGAFAMSELLPLSMLGFALAVAVLLDATLVRLVLAPALLAVAGRWNWWPGETVSYATPVTTNDTNVI